MKTNSFLLFCFAFIPGAGQMYLGMMKRGVSLMLAFSLISMAAGALNLPFLVILLPVLWFYAFFDTFNNRSLSLPERAAEDRFLFNLEEALSADWMAVMKKRHILTGGCCITLGVYLLYNNLLRTFLWRYSDSIPWLGDLLRGIPTLIVAIAIIALGIHLVFGKEKTPPVPRDYTEYGGSKHE